MRRGFAVLVGLMIIVSTAHATEFQEFSGAFERAGKNFSIDGVDVPTALATKILMACAVGQQCVVRGIADGCPGVHGSCLLMKRVFSARWGKTLPPCTASAATERADEWWSNNASVVLRGTIRRNSSALTEIVLDLTTCSTGSPIAIVRVPERWMGHYVDVNGTAVKEGGMWSIFAGDIKDAE